MKIALFILAALTLLLLVSGGFVFFTACLRRKELPWLVEAQLKKTPYGKYYDYIVLSYNWLQSHKTKEVYMTSRDGLKLHGLWIPAENPKGTVLFAHGYRSTYLVDFGHAMEFYHQMGMNILLPCQRAHGKSEGKYITFGTKESQDMQEWIQYHNENFGEFPILLDGISMGASTMLYLADKDLPHNVKAILADCGFTSPKDIISSVFRTVTHLPAVPTIWIADLFAQMFAGFRLSSCDTRKVLRKSRLPVMMVHGAADDFVPCEMTQEGFDACTSDKKLLLVDGAAHGLSFLCDRERYCDMVCDLLDKYVFK